jgi:hypothetical protein
VALFDRNDYDVLRMGRTFSTSFNCPHCGAQYDLARVEADTVTVGEEITFCRCGGPLNGREGRFLLKYFLVSHPWIEAQRRRRR